MFVASLVLYSLLIAAPLTTIFDGPIVHGLVTAAAAISVAAVALRIRSVEADFLLVVSRPIIIAAAVPAIWMLIQVLPLGNFGLARSIWESAASALGRPISGSISIDPGATIISLTRYLSAISIVFAAAAIAVDRQRAKLVLGILVASTTAIALIMLVADLHTFNLFRDGNSLFSNNRTIAGAALGIVLAAAGAMHRPDKEDYTKLRKSNTVGSGRYRPTFSAHLGAFFVCSMAFIFNAPSQAYFAIAGGIAALGATFTIQRFSLGPWGISAILTLSLFVVVAVIIVVSGDQNVDLMLAFAPRSLAPLVEVTQRILADAGSTGFGGGTFAALVPIYRNIDELTIGSVAPNEAVTIAIEMGRPFLWAGLLSATALIVTLLRSALRRQRDSVYSTAGAGCGVVITLLAFCDASLFSTPVLIIAAAAIGMAIAQRQRRSIR